MTEKIKPQSDRELPNIVTALLQERGFDCDLNDVDVSQVKDFTGVFNVSHNWEFVGDISKWDTSNAQRMTRMFQRSEFNGDVSKWDVSNVTDMGHMFCSAKFTGDVSRWDVAKVEDMNHMFEFCKITSDLSAWDVSKVKNMFRMFVGSPFNGDVSDWNVASCENFAQMFLASKFTGDISRWSPMDIAQVPSVVEDHHMALFKEPNFYHWYVLISKRADSIAGIPTAWKEHGASAREVGVAMGMPDHEIWHWAQRTWSEKKGLQLVLPEGLDATPAGV